uniref:Uncharacterized protein n=1 Tax=Arundo donax TaxID=35708 RepID=A0A0A8YHR3_ARUDO
MIEPTFDKDFGLLYTYKGIQTLRWLCWRSNMRLMSLEEIDVNIFLISRTALELNCTYSTGSGTAKTWLKYRLVLEY